MFADSSVSAWINHHGWQKTWSSVSLSISLHQPWKVLFKVLTRLSLVSKQLFIRDHATYHLFKRTLATRRSALKITVCQLCVELSDLSNASTKLSLAFYFSCHSSPSNNKPEGLSFSSFAATRIRLPLDFSILYSVLRRLSGSLVLWLLRLDLMVLDFELEINVLEVNNIGLIIVCTIYSYLCCPWLNRSRVSLTRVLNLGLFLAPQQLEYQCKPSHPLHVIFGPTQKFHAPHCSP